MLFAQENLHHGTFCMAETETTIIRLASILCKFYRSTSVPLSFIIKSCFHSIAPYSFLEYILSIQHHRKEPDCTILLFFSNASWISLCNLNIVIVIQNCYKKSLHFWSFLERLKLPIGLTWSSFKPYHVEKCMKHITFI